MEEEGGNTSPNWLFSMQWIPVKPKGCYSNLRLIPPRVILSIDKHVHPAFGYQFDGETATKIILNRFRKKEKFFDSPVAIISNPVYPVINPEFVWFSAWLQCDDNTMQIIAAIHWHRHRMHIEWRRSSHSNCWSSVSRNEISLDNHSLFDWNIPPEWFGIPKRNRYLNFRVFPIEKTNDPIDFSAKKRFTLNIAHLPISACVISSNRGNSTSSEFQILIFDTSIFTGLFTPVDAPMHRKRGTSSIEIPLIYLKQEWFHFWRNSPYLPLKWRWIVWYPSVLFRLTHFDTRRRIPHRPMGCRVVSLDEFYTYRCHSRRERNRSTVKNIRKSKQLNQLKLHWRWECRKFAHLVREDS